MTCKILPKFTKLTAANIRTQDYPFPNVNLFSLMPGIPGTLLGIGCAVFNHVQNCDETGFCVSLRPHQPGWPQLYYLFIFPVLLYAWYIVSAKNHLLHEWKSILHHLGYTLCMYKNTVFFVSTKTFTQKCIASYLVSLGPTWKKNIFT